MPKSASFFFVVGALRRLLDAADQAIIAGSYTGVLGDADLGLFTGWPGNSAGLALADLTECDFDGYARQAVTWSSDYTDSSGHAAKSSGAHVFNPSGNTTANTVIGFFLVDESGDLIGVGIFDESVALSTTDDQATIVVEITVAPAVQLGEATVVD